MIVMTRQGNETRHFKYRKLSGLAALANDYGLTTFPYF